MSPGDTWGACRGATVGADPARHIPLDAECAAGATVATGAGRVRTGDPLLAKQVLCQLSYDPVMVGFGKERAGTGVPAL